VETLVVELARRGKLLVGEPFFEGGVPVTVDRKGSGDASVGDLAVVRLGRGRARVEQTLGRPEEVGRIVHFLAADASGYITGQVWGVNGGLDM